MRLSFSLSSTHAFFKKEEAATYTLVLNPKPALLTVLHFLL